MIFYFCDSILIQRYFIQLAYNGASHSGWQKQNNAKTIQESIEIALCKILRLHEISTVGCGRTDAGVHAKKFFAHVEMEIPDDLDLVYRMNQVLPNEIAIERLIEVKKDAHTRYDAIKREYKYKIHFKKNPFQVLDSALMNIELDVDQMNQAAKALIGTKDFTSFAKVDNDASHHFCDVYHAEWQVEDRGVVFTIAANRFLRNMVRAVVGSLIEVGVGKRSIDDFEKLILAKNRNVAGASAPAVGLSLTNVEYPYELT